MVLRGMLWKEGKFWIVEVPDLDLITQGRTRREAYKMIADAMECLVNRKGFRVRVFRLPGNEFVVHSKSNVEMVALFLRRQRAMSKLTVREVTKKLGYGSPNAYAQYESGRHLPSLDWLSRFIAAINPRACVMLGVMCLQGAQAKS